MSVADWINAYVPDGMTSPFGSLCHEGVISEYGGLPELQSALNLVFILNACGLCISMADANSIPTYLRSLKN